MGVAEKLRQLRQIHGISQQIVADKLGVKQSAIASYESGRNEPGIQALIELAKLFNVSVDYLIGAEERTADSKNVEILKRIDTLSESNKIVVEKIITALADESADAYRQSKKA